MKMLAQSQQEQNSSKDCSCYGVILRQKNQELHSSLPSRMAAVIKCKSTITNYYFKEEIFIFLSMQLSSYFDF